MRLLAGVALLSVAIQAFEPALQAAETTGWESVPGITARIQPPQFPKREFRITDFGAIGDGKTDCKPAFDKAFTACSSAGGGRVVIPAGEWFVGGSIHLKS